MTRNSLRRTHTKRRILSSNRVEGHAEVVRLPGGSRMSFTTFAHKRALLASLAFVVPMALAASAASFGQSGQPADSNPQASPAAQSTPTAAPEPADTKSTDTT